MNASRTVRLFVSSTFSDLKAERDALQLQVFPHLKQLCLSKGFRFQAIDLRWGVSEEAGRDNRTMRICLRELARCQQDRPKPNFLILLGDRYGWRPLPETIPAGLFEKLAAQLQATHSGAAQLFRQRYLVDQNAVPPVAELQPRGKGEDWQEQVEKPLLAALEQAAQTLGLDPEQEGVAIGASATEQEIVEGALKVPGAATHVRAFFRAIDGLPDNPPPRDYVDLGDPTAKLRLAALKDRIEHHIGRGSVCRYRVPWRGDGIHAADLEEFCEQAWKLLSEVVEQQIAALAKVPAGELEDRAHRQFGEERCRRFVGRGEPLARIAAYLRQGSDEPLAVIGPSGSGKSAVMAMAVQAAGENSANAQIVARYIGATPVSSDLLQLLRNLVGEIRRRYPVAGATDGEIPSEFNPLVNAFHQALQRATLEQPLFLFLDSLDQLTASHRAHGLGWLPARLSAHVRLVVSAALPPADGRAADFSDPRPAIMAALQSRLDVGQRVALAPLDAAEGGQMLTNWLADAHRTLQAPQRQAILETFQAEGSPLWLRTAAEEAARLASWKPAPSFAPTTRALLDQVLDRLSQAEEHGGILVSRTLSYLACARHGLAEDEMLDILSADSEVMADFLRRSPNSPKADSLPVAVWVRLHGDLAFYLTEHQAQEGASLLGFYHRGFLETVTARCLASPEDRRLRHRHMAQWFGQQPWFLAPVIDEAAPAQGAINDPPNARKASELPWHLYRTAAESDPQRCQDIVWQPLADALCDILLVEAKVRSGLVLELQEDYHLALDALPEMVSEVKQRKESEARIERWTAETIAYARAWSERRDRQARGERVREPEPVLPEPLPACRMWSEAEIETECQRIVDQPTRLDGVRAFAAFVASQCHGLLEYGRREGFAIQHAFNQAPGGLVHSAAAGRIAELHCPLMLRRWPEEERPNPMPALLRTLQGHTGAVTGVSVTPDGRRAVSASDDHTLRLWDLESGQCLRTLTGHTDAIHGVSMTPDARRAVSVSDNQMRVWDLGSGQCLRTLAGAFKHVSVMPDGRSAVSASIGGLRVWDLESGQCLRTLVPRADLRLAVRYAVRDTRKFLSRLKEWAKPAGTHPSSWLPALGQAYQTAREFRSTLIPDIKAALARDEIAITSVSVTPDGRRAVSGPTLRVWDLASGRYLRTLEGRFNAVFGVTPDGRRAVSASSGYDKLSNYACLWDLESGQCLRTLPGRHYWAGDVSVSVTPDGRRAVIGSHLRTLHVWDLETGQCLRTLEGRTGYVTSVDLTPDGRYAVSGSRDTTLCVWDLEKGQSPRTVAADIPFLDNKTRDVYNPDTTYVTSLSLTCGGSLVVSRSRRELKVWNLESAQRLWTLDPHNGMFLAVSVTPNGRCVVWMSNPSTMSLRVWNLESGLWLRTLEGQHASVKGLAVTPDGRLAVSPDLDNTLRVWDVESGQCLRTLVGHTGVLACLSLMPDGRRAVSWSLDMKLRVWDLDSGQCLRTLIGDQSSEWVNRVSVTPDGRYAVASTSHDDKLVVWDLESGRCLWMWTLAGNQYRGENSVSFTPDGKVLFTSSGRTLRVWDLESGQCLRTVEGQKDVFNCICAMPDGRHAVSGSSGDDRTVRVWDLASGSLVAVCPAPAAISSLALAASGSVAVCGMHDGEVIMVELRGIDGSRTDLAPSPPRRAPEWRLFNPYVRVAGLLIVDEDGVETEVSECGVVYERPYQPDYTNTVRDGLILERGEAFKKIPWYRIERVTARGPDAMTVSLRDGTSLDPVKLASGTLTGTDGFGLEFQLSLGCVRTITPRLDTLQVARTIPAIASRNAVTPPPAIHGSHGHPLGRKLGLQVTDAKGAETELLVFGVDYMPFSQSSLDNAVRDYLIIDRGRGCLMIRWDQMERMVVPSHDSTTIVLLDGSVIGPVKLRWGGLVGTNARGRQFVFGWEYVRAITVFLR